MTRASIWMRHIAVSLVLVSCACGGEEPSHDAGEREDAAAKISDTALSAQMVRIQTAVRQYRALKGSLPEDVDALVAEGLITREAAIDPWGHPWVIVSGEDVQVISYGADGKPGGTGPDRDRTSP